MTRYVRGQGRGPGNVDVKEDVPDGKTFASVPGEGEVSPETYDGGNVSLESTEGK